MAEYNFWDDRTWDCDDNYWCPILNDYCFTEECDICPINKKFEESLRASEQKPNSTDPHPTDFC